MKGSFITSTFPLIAAFTCFIYPLVMGIVVLSNCNKFENKGIAIACGVLAFFVLPIGLFIPFGMGFALKYKQ